jgi:hypothetical protein
MYQHEAIADGVLYTSTGEHSPTQPRWRGGTLFAIDVYTGKFLWNLSGNIGSNYAGKPAVAGGTFIGTNEYDGTMYAIAKGQTTTTVTAPQTAVSKGAGVLISGTVMDQSPAQPDTPAVSDDSMTAWMNYLHMQLPLTATITGVPVMLTAVAPDGTCMDIGSTTTDGYGTFFYSWTPPNTGIYKIQATFAGSNSYYSSTAQTAVSVASTSASASISPATSASTSPSVAPPPSSEASSMTLYIAIAAVAVIVVIIAVALVLRRRKKTTEKNNYPPFFGKKTNS